jgi:hypothetical protein
MPQKVVVRAIIFMGTACALGAQDPERNDRLPAVYFNHSDIVLDPAIYDAIAQSEFLKEEFGVVERTAFRSPTDSFTFLGVNGKRTYLALFKPSKERPENQINFNMWVDDRQKLPLVRDSLAMQTSADATIRAQQRVRDGRVLNSVDGVRAVYPATSDGVRAGTSVISPYAEAISCRALERGQPVAREVQQSCKSDLIRQVSDITSFTIVVSQQESERLQKEFGAYGYTIRDERGSKIIMGPEIEFVLLTANAGPHRRIAIGMKLNREKEGDQVYTLGDGSSEVRFNGATATWYFPAGWRP